MEPGRPLEALHLEYEFASCVYNTCCCVVMQMKWTFSNLCAGGMEMRDTEYLIPSITFTNESRVEQ